MNRMRHDFSNPQHREAEQTSEHDTRPKATGWIWFWAFLMMGPSTAISGITGTTAVPLCVIGGAALSSAFVWAFGGRRARRDPASRAEMQQAAAESARLRGKVEELEERLFSLETIGRYEQARRERAEEARFGAPHQAAHPPSARDPLLPDPEWPVAPSAPPRTSQPRGRGPGAFEG